jgi:hypothetical protein
LAQKKAESVLQKMPVLVVVAPSIHSFHPPVLHELFGRLVECPDVSLFDHFAIDIGGGSGSLLITGTCEFEAFST